MHPGAAGKFIEIGGERFLVKGVSYGTFAPDADQRQFPRLEQVRKDFAAMAKYGFNTVRTYTVPTLELLDEAANNGLRVMIGMPWAQHVAFLDDPQLTRNIRRDAVRQIRALGSHPAALLFAVGNEIPPAVVRWHGQERVTRFLRDLYDDAKAASPDSLLTYVNYPPTEFLELDCFDVCSFNVYLHRETDLRPYLARLQQIAGARPLLLAEAGADSIREGGDGQAAITAMHVRAAFEEGLCGAVAFSWTDEWWRGGHQIDDWAFGLVDAERRPKPALAAVSAAFAAAPFAEEHRRSWPTVSVVVCAYNAADTIDDCLESLGRLTYPNFEVIVINDGSRDATGEIARRYPVRVIDVPNGGLSAARNLGLSAASGEIVAYTDADVRVDPDWLSYLVQPFLTSDVVGSGGPNVVPPDDPFVAQSVARAPGGPVHVMLDDRIAEHVPGCNMAFRRDALLAIGGFNPVYLRAGDDVDVCWRLQARKQKIGFAPSALVWHHHRASVTAYWRQQVGYGEGEVWLEAHHPEKFVHGTMVWHGRIYSPLPFIRSLSRRRVNSGTWGTAAFPSVYSSQVHPAQLLPHSPAWQGISTLALGLGLGALTTTSFVGLATLLLLAGAFGWTMTIARCVMFGWQADLNGLVTARGRANQLRHRLLIAWLHFLQPLARFTGRVRGHRSPPALIEPERATRLTWRVPMPERSDAFASARLLIGGATEERFWSESWTSHDALLTETAGLLRAARPARFVEVDDGWRQERDVSVAIGRWGWLDVRALIEEHGGSKCLLRVGMRLRPAFIGVVAALSLVLLSVSMTRTAVILPWPWISAGCVLLASVLFGRGVWQTTSAVTLARSAVARAAITAGMTPIPMQPRPRSQWQFKPRYAMVSQRVQGLVLVLLTAGAFQTAASLLRDTGSFGAAAADALNPAAALAAVAEIDVPGDVALAPNGDLLFADARRGVIHRFDISALNEPRETRAALVSGADVRQLISAEWRIDSPASVAVGSDGDLYVADARNNRISRIDRTSGDIAVAAGSGTAGFDGDARPAASARLDAPRSVAVADSGDVYIADTGNNRVRVVSAVTGLIRTIAGDGTPGPAGGDEAAIGDGGPAVRAHLSAPMDVAVAPNGDVYIADMGHNRVRVVAADSGIINTVAGNGSIRSEGDTGSARAAGLAGPAGLALSSSRRGVTVFVAEQLGGNVRMVTPDGAISTVGHPMWRFSAPSRLAYRRGGWLYVASHDGTLTVVNVSRARPAQVATVGTGGRSGDEVAVASRTVQ
jgi:GT2 family glycosyltransferase/sugar lactone lactonase YvrE